MTNKFDKIIEKLFCKHIWKQKYARSIIYEGKTRKVIFILICDKCGKIKKVRMDAFS